MTVSCQNIGFVGVGAMGKAMVVNFARKSICGTRIFIHDINEAVVTELCTAHAGTIIKCSSAKEVAEKTVRYLSLGTLNEFIYLE
jgi:pyrroline-5-carboxylate reductase